MKKHFRKKLLVDNIIPKKINDISKKYRNLLLKDLEKGLLETETVTKCHCGCQQLETISKIDRFGLPFGSLICKGCGLILTSPRLKEKSLPYYYDKYYHPLNFGIENLNNRNALFGDGQGKKIFNKLKQYLPNKKMLKVLEIGTGTGSVLQEFKDAANIHSIQVNELGTEYSQECIKACQQRNINVTEGNLETIVNKNETYDIIILSHVFEHFIHLKKELNNLKKIMTEDTLLYIEVPGLFVNHKKWYYDFSYLIYHVHAHMYNFSKDTLTNVLSQSGFIEIDSNEEVEAIYKIGNPSQSHPKNIMQKTLDYLLFLDENQEYFLKEFKDKIFYEKQYRQQQQTIINREQTIKGKESLIHKQQQTIQKQQQTIINREQTIKGKESLIHKQQQKLQELEQKLRKIKISILKLKRTYILIHPIKKYKYYKEILKDIL
jgi:ubiquinone/menaquinone biosynthesis C-methylase UbiE